MPIKRWDNFQHSEYFSDNENNQNQKKHTARKIIKSIKVLQNWVIALWIISVLLLIICVYLFIRINNWNRINSLEKTINIVNDDISDIQSDISFLESNRRITVPVLYEWGSSRLNNVSWVWDKSLWYPELAKNKYCYIIWEKIRWSWWGSIWWRIWIAWDWWRYTYSTMYEADLNNTEQKIEITKNWWYSNSNLTTSERNNLYLSLTLLCY